MANFVAPAAALLVSMFSCSFKKALSFFWIRVNSLVTPLSITLFFFCSTALSDLAIASMTAANSLRSRSCCSKTDCSCSASSKSSCSAANCCCTNVTSCCCAASRSLAMVTNRSSSNPARSWRRRVISVILVTTLLRKSRIIFSNSCDGVGWATGSVFCTIITVGCC